YFGTQMASSQFITVRGLQLHYLDYPEFNNSPGRPLLICLHSLSGNAHEFDHIAQEFSAYYRVLSIDVRGRGESAWGPAEEYTLTNYLEDFSQLFEQLEVKKATLLGTSMGGLISIMFAGTFPDKVEKLILNDIGPDIEPEGVKHVIEYISSAPQVFENIEELMSYYRTIYPHMQYLSDAKLWQKIQWATKETDEGKLTWKMDPAIRQKFYPAETKTATPIDIGQFFKEITAPILVIRGANSNILSLKTVEKMQSIHPQLTFVEVPDTGHAPLLSEPESMKALKLFLLDNKDESHYTGPFL
ncbi:MAG: alpha/beta fold hydrolase, partial [Legionellales bacterium]